MRKCGKASWCCFFRWILWKPYWIRNTFTSWDLLVCTWDQHWPWYFIETLFFWVLICTKTATENMKLTQIMYLWSLCVKWDPAKELFYKVQRSVLISCAHQSIWFCKSIEILIGCSQHSPQQAALCKSSLSRSPRQMIQN